MAWAPIPAQAATQNPVVVPAPVSSTGDLSNRVGAAEATLVDHEARLIVTEASTADHETRLDAIGLTWRIQRASNQVSTRSAGGAGQGFIQFSTFTDNDDPTAFTLTTGTTVFGFPSSTLTVNYTGTYIVNMCLSLAVNAAGGITSFLLAVVKNGATTPLQESRGNFLAASSSGVAASATLKLTAGDTLDLFFSYTSGTPAVNDTIQGGDATYLALTRIK